MNISYFFVLFLSENRAWKRERRPMRREHRTAPTMGRVCPLPVAFCQLSFAIRNTRGIAHLLFVGRCIVGGHRRRLTILAGLAIFTVLTRFTSIASFASFTACSTFGGFVDFAGLINRQTGEGGEVGEVFFVGRLDDGLARLERRGDLGFEFGRERFAHRSFGRRHGARGQVLALHLFVAFIAFAFFFGLLRVWVGVADGRFELSLCARSDAQREDEGAAQNERARRRVGFHGNDWPIKGSVILWKGARG